MDHGVLTIDYGPTTAVEKSELAHEPAALQLLVWYGGGEPTRAAWRWAGRLAGWAAVGKA